MPGSFAMCFVLQCFGPIQVPRWGPSRPVLVPSCSRAFLTGSGLDGQKQTSWPLPPCSDLETNRIQRALQRILLKAFLLLDPLCSRQADWPPDLAKPCQLGDSVNRWTLKTEKLLSSSPSRQTTLRKKTDKEDPHKESKGPPA